MEKLTMWLKISSVAAVISAVSLTLIPESKLKNTFRTISSLIVVFSLFSAFSTVQTDKLSLFDNEEEISVSLEEKSKDLIAEEGEEFIDSLLSEKLMEAGFDVSCKSELYETEGEFKIKSVTVYGIFNEEEKAEIVRVINENIKGVNEVIFVEDSNEE